MVEPRYPGVVERYVNLGDCYDKKALGDVRQEIMGAMAGYKECYARAYRCLDAAGDIQADIRSLVTTPEVEARIAKRAKGILGREVRKNGGEAGRVVRRFLSAVTHQGELWEFGTVDAQCKRVYELADTYGLAHLMLARLLAGAVAAGHDVIACPSPMDPERLEHLLIPGLSLAFVTSTPAHPYPGRPYRRIRMDAMAEHEAVCQNRPRLRFARKVAAALVEEAVASLAQAKAMHDDLEALYNPYVDFQRVRTMAQAIGEEILEN